MSSTNLDPQEYETATNTQPVAKLSRSQQYLQISDLSQVAMLKKYYDQPKKQEYKLRVQQYCSSQGQLSKQFSEQKLTQILYGRPIFGGNKGEAQLLKIVRQELPLHGRVQSGVSNILRDVSKIFLLELIETTVQVMCRKGENHPSAFALREAHLRLTLGQRGNDFI